MQIFSTLGVKMERNTENEVKKKWLHSNANIVSKYSENASAHPFSDGTWQISTTTAKKCGRNGLRRKSLHVYK